MIKTISYSTLFLFLIAPTVFAQSLMDGYSYKSEYNYSSRSTQFKQKSEGVAFVLTIGVPIATILIGKSLYRNNYRYTGGSMIAAGIFIGPSAGNMYAKNPMSVGKGIYTKFLGAGVTAIGAHQLLMCWGGCPESRSYMEISGLILYFAGLGIYVYSFIYDVINSPINVRKYNDRSTPKFNIGPTYYPEHSTAGLGFRLSL
ncbi:MAG: hypothetical protein WC967_07435 [Balneolaceae bacterium]